MKIIRIKKGKPYLFTDVKAWGGKGDNLLRLNQVFNVPSGFIISSDTYQEWINQAQLNSFIDQTLKDDVPLIATQAQPRKRNLLSRLIKKDQTDIQEYSLADNENKTEQVYNTIRSKFLATELPEDLVSKLEDEFSRLEMPIAVRSSSINEDGAKNSYAGRHETILGVSIFEEFSNAIREVYASLFTPRAISYRTNKGLTLDDSIAIVAQTMVNPVVSGVAYSPSPNNENEILIESNYGLCTSIVEGRVCDIYRVLDTITGNTILDISTKKSRMDTLDKSKKSVVTVDVARNKAGKSSLTPEQVLEIAKAAKSIERSYGMPMDIEWAYDTDNNLYVLQARPITGLRINEETIKLPNIPQKRILARSKNTRKTGIYEGPTVVVKEIDHVNSKIVVDGNIVDLNRQFGDGYILLAPEIPLQLEQYVTNARAMYATECGTTGHAASVACEKGIVYMGRGVNTLPDLLSKIRSGTKLGIAVSKDEGILYLLE